MPWVRRENVDIIPAQEGGGARLPHAIARCVEWGGAVQGLSKNNISAAMLREAIVYMANVASAMKAANGSSRPDVDWARRHKFDTG
jgi:hypothetical protein